MNYPSRVKVEHIDTEDADRFLLTLDFRFVKIDHRGRIIVWLRPDEVAALKDNCTTALAEDDGIDLI